MLSLTSISICLVWIATTTTTHSFLNSIAPTNNVMIKINNKMPSSVVLRMADGDVKANDPPKPDAPKTTGTVTKQSQYGVTTEAIDSYVKCGKCKNFFYLSPEDLGNGRGKRLQCSVCNHSWFQSADRIIKLKPGFELQSLDENDLNRIKENVAQGKPYDFVGDGKLYVGNLSFNVSEDDLIEAFSEYGEVGDAFIVQDQDGRPRGFAFVTMRTMEDSKKVMDALDGEEVFGRRLQIREPNN